MCWIIRPPTAGGRRRSSRPNWPPLLRHNDIARVGRVLDVGCGPGTNAPLFHGHEYLGLDLNPRYISQARRRFGDRFQVADVCTYEADPDRRFDFILMNSLLHHIDTPSVGRILRQLSRQLTVDGCIHVLDLVLPPRPSVARTLALADRGDFPRPLTEWRSLFEACYEVVVFEQYAVRAAGVPLWQMVYFKGRAPSEANGT